MTAVIWIALIVCGVGTFLERFAFLAVADRAATVPDGVREALRMIPAAALAALVAPAILRGGSVDGGLSLVDGRLIAAAAALVVMRRSGNVLLTIVVGMAVLLVAGALMGGSGT